MSDSALSRAVERHAAREFGPDTGRAAVTFLGTEQIEVLRFGPDRGGIVRYLTLGMSREPMTAADSAVRDPAGPRAELVLSLRGRRDSVLRRLAVLAAIPVVEARPVAPGAVLDLGEPLWDGAPFSAVLVAEPGGLLPDLTVPDEPAAAPVRFLPVLPMTANEAAHKRVHGPDSLHQRWLAAGTDLRDPSRREVALT
ncbi:suppressor of fused domain protein [Frankia sp. AgB32]|uniref:suppressor of fused domain protein n=1 Tax=Frankia sp. AgB32 TaxID=631119 RepID=UPI00200CA654|nr:suppressor of fused domain protein [Frankia sp. AgB32]MCK9893752.1 suppressor of fused domain protein [Frankia sp. AgB32]